LKKRILLLFLSITLVFSNLAIPTFAANNDYDREVYLHAQENPDRTAPAGGEAFLGQDVNIYLAVDEPNNPTTQLNGYFVKLYYNPEFLKIKDESKLLEYDYPYKTQSTNEQYRVSGNVLLASKGTYNGPITGTEVIGDTTYNYISALVFYGGFDLPEEKIDNNDVWYNIFRITFEAIQDGTTDVFIDTTEFNEIDEGFQLFTKHQTNGKKYFNSRIRNAGNYLLNIKNISRPAAPQINKATGSYTPNDLLAGEITITAEAGCEIWYTTEPDAPDELNLKTDGNGRVYDDYYKCVPNNIFVSDFSIDETTTLKAIARRISNDGQTAKESWVTKKTYRIVPHSPSLFFVEQLDENDKIIVSATSPKRINPPYYNSSSAFYVCIDDSNEYDGSLDLPNEIYYTFSLADVSEVLNYDDTATKDGKIEWVKLDPRKMDSPIEITENCNIRIVTKRKTELSGVTEYLLSISPEPAHVTDDYMKPNQPQSSVDVKLKSETRDAEIYYTLDGSDPRIQGGSRTKYEDGDVIPVQKSLILTTVAYYDGVYSALTPYAYDFGIPGSLWVDASHQSGDYDGELEVHLISANVDDEIYYTTDGTTPTDQSIKYDRTKPIKITEDMVVKAVAKDKEGNYSEVKTFFYYIKPKAPEFRPQTTQFSENGEVHIHSEYDEIGYELWITTDGTDPREQTQNTIKIVGNFYAVKDIDDYTVIKAVVAKTSGADVVFSDLVMHTYDVVTSRPSKPTPTLVPGTYTLTPESSGFSTEFVYPGDNIKIYYTISTSAESPYPPNDPVGSKLWEGEAIPITGETIIKAVAEDIFGRRSQIGLYYYKIVPEAPTAPTSASYNEMDFIPVTAVKGSEITYTINGVTHTIPESNMEDRTIFYIDSKTGKAYADDDVNSTRLDSGNDQEITAPITLELSCEKDGVPSSTSTYHYNIGENPAPPFVSANPGGEYPQKSQTQSGAYVKVEFDTLEKDAEIWYCTDSENISDETAWQKYDKDSGIEIFDDTTLHARVKKDGKFSNMITEVYTFKPMPPVVTPDSGTYSGEQEVTIKFDDNAKAPDGSSYIIKYSINGEVQNDEIYPRQERKIPVSDTTTVKAWVVEVDDRTGKTIDESESVINYYFIDTTTAGQGTVKFGEPFDTRHRFATWELDKISGIKLKGEPSNYQIYYEYRYQDADGTWYPSATDYTDEMIYNNVPIGISPAMKQIVVHAWLMDGGNPVPGSEIEKTFTFVDLGIPQPTPDEGSYTSNQTVKLINEYSKTEYPNRFIYYTTNTSADYTKGEFTKYTDEIDEKGITISSNTTLRTVYYDACGEDSCIGCVSGNYEQCQYPVWGEVGEFKYYITKSTGGGGGGGGGSSGGGGSTTTKKKYTIDHFGNEHPHHTNYLYGYPDGTVQGDGNITREETAAILYRVYHIDYVEPHPAQGDQYPDVTADMWSAASIEYLSDVGLIMGYYNSSVTKEYSKCLGANFTASIGHDMNLYFCCSHIGNLAFSVGNLRERSLKELLTDSKRKSLIENPCFSYCQTQCRNHNINKILNDLSKLDAEQLDILITEKNREPQPIHCDFL